MVILVDITPDSVEVTAGKMCGNGFNEDGKMGMVLNEDGKMGVAEF